MLQGVSGIFNPNAEGTNRWSMNASKGLSEAIGFMIDNEVDIALLIKSDVFGSMARGWDESQLFEQSSEFFGVVRCVFDEFKAIGPKRIFHLFGLEFSSGGRRRYVFAVARHKSSRFK